MEDSMIQRHGERIAALEASYQHLATKDDISRLRLELEHSVNRLQANIDALKRGYLARHWRRSGRARGHPGCCCPRLESIVFAPTNDQSSDAIYSRLDCLLMWVFWTRQSPNESRPSHYEGVPIA